MIQLRTRCTRERERERERERFCAVPGEGRHRAIMPPPRTTLTILRSIFSFFIGIKCIEYIEAEGIFASLVRYSYTKKSVSFKQ